MNLTVDDLKNKNLPGVQKLFALSFEYLLVCISKEYSRINEYKTIGEFNSKNRLNFSKAILFPFFVSLSNGHSKALYGLFGDFYSLSFGPVSFGAASFISTPAVGSEMPGLSYFEISGTQNPVGIEINTQKVSSPADQSPDICFEKIKEKLKEIVINLKGLEVRFQDIVIYSDLEKEKQLYLAIESGIKAIKEQSSNFFNADVDVMKLHASYFDAFKKRLKASDVSVIEYSELEEGKRRPFYQEDISVSE